MNKNKRLSQQRLPSNSRGLADKQSFSSANGIGIIGELAAKYWLIFHGNKEEKTDETFQPDDRARTQDQ